MKKAHWNATTVVLFFFYNKQKRNLQRDREQTRCLLCTCGGPSFHPWLIWVPEHCWEWAWVRARSYPEYHQVFDLNKQKIYNCSFLSSLKYKWILYTQREHSWFQPWETILFEMWELWNYSLEIIFRIKSHVICKILLTFPVLAKQMSQVQPPSGLINRDCQWHFSNF